MSTFIPSFFVPSSDFPSDVLKWMKINSISKPKSSLKLMKTNKFFQHSEFPFYPVNTLQYIGSIQKWQIITLDFKDRTFEGFEGVEHLQKQFWITYELRLTGSPKNISHFIKKISVCDVRYLIFTDKELSYDEFKFLTYFGNVEFLQIIKTMIDFVNGDPVFADDILKCVPKVKHYNHSNHESGILSPDFDIKIKEFDISKLKSFNISLISYAEFKTILKFMNENPNISFSLFFPPNSLSFDESKIIEKYIQNIIEMPKYPIPFIQFPGQTQEQYDALRTLYDQQQNKEI